MNQHRALAHWLAPLAEAVPELSESDLRWLDSFESELISLLAAAPAWATRPGQRGRWLLSLRRQLAAHLRPAGHDAGQRALLQTLTQFVCGFHDLDLRDAYGPGHGALVLAGAEPTTRAYWRSRLARGALVGIAATESRGGSRLREITTSAQRVSASEWRLTGEKCWISRLSEASGLVIFFLDPDRQLSAAIIDADRPGLVRGLRKPAGLAGWSWGILRLDNVAIDPFRDLLAGPGQGDRLFRRHFARFRPLVAATALGAAARVHSTVAATLATRARAGAIRRVRDNALILLGRTHAEVTAALLSALATSRLAAREAAPADLWARVGKPYAVDLAYRAVTELALLMGAAGFQADSLLAKACRDLFALLYADGIHDSLYRSGGRSLLAHHQPHTGSQVTRAELDRAA